jgi:hypothetical protein
LHVREGGFSDVSINKAVYSRLSLASVAAAGSQRTLLFVRCRRPKLRGGDDRNHAGGALTAAVLPSREAVA